jgi:hypothetical protein
MNLGLEWLVEGDTEEEGEGGRAAEAGDKGAIDVNR